MSEQILLKGGTIENEGKKFVDDVLIQNGRIEKIGEGISHPSAKVIDLQGKYLLPGCIDDQVHFREPGLTHKGDIHSEFDQHFRLERIIYLLEVVCF